MRLIIVFIFLVAHSELVFGSWGVYEENGEYKISEYVERIDTTDIAYLKNLLEEVMSDSTMFIYAGRVYTTCEYLFIKMFLSANPITLKRQKFIEEIIESDISFEKPTTRSLLAYIRNEDLNLNIVEIDSLNESFMSSLVLAKKICSTQYSKNYSEFIKQVNHFFEEYTSLPNDYNDLRLLVPMNELLKIWKNNFPKEFKLNVHQFILSKDWALLEDIKLLNFVGIISQNELKSKSMFNLDPMVWSCSFVWSNQNDYFIIKNGDVPWELVLSENNSIKNKKRCIKKNVN
jgi:hypothetical protein